MHWFDGVWINADVWCVLKDVTVRTFFGWCCRSLLLQPFWRLLITQRCPQLSQQLPSPAAWELPSYAGILLKERPLFCWCDWGPLGCHGGGEHQVQSKWPGSRGEHILREAGEAACSTAEPCGCPCPSWLACWLVSLQLAYRKAPIPIHCPLGAASSRGRVFQATTGVMWNKHLQFAMQEKLFLRTVHFVLCHTCIVTFSKTEWDGASSGVPVI